MRKTLLKYDLYKGWLQGMVTISTHLNSSSTCQRQRIAILNTSSSAGMMLGAIPLFYRLFIYPVSEPRLTKALLYSGQLVMRCLDLPTGYRFL